MLPALLFLSFEIGMFSNDTRLRGSARVISLLFSLSFWFSFSSSESFLSPIPVVVAAAAAPQPPLVLSLFACTCGSIRKFSLLLFGSKYLLISAMLLCGLVGVTLCRSDSGTCSFMGDPPAVLLLFTLALGLELEPDEKLSVDKDGLRGLNTGFWMELLRLVPPVTLALCVDIPLGSAGSGLLLE